MTFKNRILQNPLFKVASLNGISMGVKVITGFVSAKAIAYFIGPSGMALMGNLRSFMAILETAGLLGLQNNIVQFVAKNNTSSTQNKAFIKTVFWFLVVFSLLLSCLLLLFSGVLSSIVFANQKNYYFISYLVALMLPFQVLHLFFVAVLNGYFQYKKITLITLFSYLVGLLLSLLFLWQFGVSGALVAMVLLSGFQVFFSGYFFFKHLSFKSLFSPITMQWELLKNTIPLGSMALFSALVSPMVFIYIRNAIATHSTIDDAGYYEAMQRISSFYMLFISSFSTFYFLPELSKNNQKEHIKKTTKTYFIIVMPLFACLLLLLFFFREIFIQLLFTKQFAPLSQFFGLQLLADFFRAASLILGIRFYAYKIVKAYFLTEMASFTILFVSSYLLIPQYGCYGAIFAYFCTYLLYFLLLVFYFQFKKIT